MKPAAHILVIRFSAMGDVAMVVPVLLVLVKKYPQLKITVLTKPFFAPIFASIPNVTVFEADVKSKYKGFFGLKQLSNELLEKEINVVADLHNVLRTKLLKFFFKLGKLPVKQLDKGRAEKKALTQQVKKNFRPLISTHQRYANVFAELGFPINLSEEIFLKKKELPKAVRKFTGVKNRKWIAIAPFAKHAGKIYPEKLMKEVLKELQEMAAVEVFLFGGSRAEVEILSEWENIFSKTKSVAGKFSFEDEIGLISNMDLMLSMDSGNGHLAANFGIPVVTVWGVTHPYLGFRAFAQPESNFLLPDLEKFPRIPTSVYGNKFPSGYEKAMESISPKEIVEKIKELVDKR